MFSVLIIHIQACIYATAEPDYQAKPTNLACKSNALETEAKFVLYFIPSSKNKFKVHFISICLRAYYELYEAAAHAHSSS